MLPMLWHATDWQYRLNIDRDTCATQEIVFFEQGEPMIDGDTGDLKVLPPAAQVATTHGL